MGDVALLGALLLAFASGCGPRDEPQHVADHVSAAALLSRVRAADYEHSWAHPPGQTGRLASASHGHWIDIFINPTLAAAATGPHLWSWPVSSVVAADASTGTGVATVLLMRKDAQGWFWARADAASGKVLEAGHHDGVCLDCHMAGSDHVRSFGFP